MSRRRNNRRYGGGPGNVSGSQGARRQRSGVTAQKSVSVILTRRNARGRTEDAEISMPFVKGSVVRERIFRQIMGRFSARDLVSISTGEVGDRRAVEFTEALDRMLQEEKRRKTIPRESYRPPKKKQEHMSFTDITDDYYSNESYGVSSEESYEAESSEEEYEEEVEYKIQWVENRVEVPKIEIVEKIVEVPQIEVVERYETVTEIQEVEVPVYREVVKAVIQEVERRVEVPGEIIESVKEVQVEIIKHQDVFHDHDVPVAVAQTMQPILQVQSKNIMKTNAMIYEPILREVNVYVPVPVEVPLDGPFRLEPSYEKIAEGEISAPQFNSITLAMNRHLLAERPEFFERMKLLEDAVKRVNPDIDSIGSELLVVRHNDDGSFSDILPMVKKEASHPGKVPLTADASVAAPKSSVIRELVDKKVLDLLNLDIT